MRHAVPFSENARPRGRTEAVMVLRRTPFHLAALLALIFAAPAAAQGVCAAPHSTGGLSAGSSVGTQPPGAGWVQLSALRWVSDDFFSPDGDVRPLLAGGRVATSSIYLTASVGVVEGVEVFARAPVHHLRFEDETGSRSRAGLGDLRAAVRVAPAAFGVPVPVVLRAGVKLPGSRFPVDATIVPLTEGQRDWELRVEYGRNLIEPSPLAPPTLYGVAWVGYRWRELNEASARKPGNELFGRLALGGLLYQLEWELGLEAVRGEPPIQQGFTLDGARRELWQIAPALAYDTGAGRLSVGAQLPVAGRNLPAGPSINLSYTLSWSGL